MIERFLTDLGHLPDYTLFALFLIENFGLFAFAILVGLLVERDNTVFPRRDVKYILSTILLNSVITFIGFKFFLLGYISVNFGFDITLLRDLLLIIFVMDFLMFAFHYGIHRVPQLYRFHERHHQHIATNVYSLFVLHPFETIGFGGLWLLTIAIFDFNFYSLALYLLLNLLYGILGHLKRDIFPRDWSENTFSKWTSDTQFHGTHHRDQDKNFGFYFTFWDKILNTYVR